MADNIHWARLRERGSMAGLWTMLTIFRWFGRPVFSLVLIPVMIYFFASNRVARTASQQFLQRCHEHCLSQGIASPFASPPTLSTSFKHFLSFGQAILDKLNAWTGLITLDHVEFSNRENFEALQQAGGGAVFIGSHLGNIEVCRAMSNLTKRFTINVLVHTKHAENFNRLMHKVNPNSGLRLFQVSEVTPATAMLLNERIEAGEIVIIVGDRVSVTQAEASSVPATFLGHDAPFPAGPFVLAALLKCPVYNLCCLRKGSKFVISLDPLTDRIRLPRRSRQQALQEIVQQYAKSLENYAIQAPLQWYNFFPFWGK